MPIEANRMIIEGNRMIIEGNRTPIEFLHLFWIRLAFDCIRQSNTNRSITIRLHSIDSIIEKFD